MRIRWRILALLGALGLVASGVQDARAQSSTTGAIGGIVKDKETGDNLAGVTIVATSPHMQGSQAALTDGRGSYKIDNLPPGIYLVTFYFSDIQIQRKDIQVRLNRTVRVDQKVDMNATKGEVIVVEEKAPTIDVTRTDEGITLDKDYLKHIPVPGRTFGRALGAAAGATTDGRGTAFSGSTSLENSYVIDGVNTTSLNLGTIGTDLINEFIEEIQVITGGYQPEYGRATGAVVNVITKSGTNEFHGSVFSTITPFVREREPIAVFNSAIDSDIKLDYEADFGVELGGPIIKDKVWFYVGFAPRLRQTNVSRFIKRFRDCQEELPDGSLSECNPEMYEDGFYDEDPNTGDFIFEEVDRDDFKTQSQTYQFVTKINFAVAPEHQGSISVLGSPTAGEGIFTTVGTRNATRADFTALNTDVAAKWTSKFNDNKTQVEAVFGWHRDKYDQDAIDQSLNRVPTIRVFLENLGTWGRAGGESQKIIDQCTDSNVRTENDPYPRIENCPIFQYWLDSPGFIIDNLEDRKSGQLKVTQRVDLAGHHEFKVGLDIENNVTEDVRKLNSPRGTPGIFYQLIPSFDQIRVWRYTSALDGNGTDACGFEELDDGTFDLDSPERCTYLESSPVHAQTINWSGFAQDSWSVRPNLTLNYGVRYEEQRMRYAEHLRGTVDNFTDEPLGNNAIRLRNMWAPRLGVIYDWTKEGRSKLYASVGRFYESIPMTLNDFSFSGDTLYRQVWALSQCAGATEWESDPSIGVAHPDNCPKQTTAANPPGAPYYYRGGVTLVTPGTKAQYMDEAILGVQYEVIEDLRLGVSYKHRGIGRVLEDVSIDAADTYIIANPGPDAFSNDEEAALVSRINDACATDDEDPECVRLTTRLEQFQGARGFDKPRRDYDALELTAIKRFSRSFYIQASYILSQARGNYPGLFSADNGQAMPNISSQYDLIELLANRDGPLPQDQTHHFKFDGYYRWDFEEAGLVTSGVRFRAFSGAPKDVLAAHYLYGFDEAYVLPRGSFGRNEFVTGTDFHLSYGRQLAKGYELHVFADIFNLFNQEQTFSVDESYTLDNANPVVGGTYEDLVYLKAANDTGFETPDPVVRNINFDNRTARFVPQSMRFGLRLSF